MMNDRRTPFADLPFFHPRSERARRFRLGVERFTETLRQAAERFRRSEGFQRLASLFGAAGDVDIDFERGNVHMARVELEAAIKANDQRTIEREPRRTPRSQTRGFRRDARSAGMGSSYRVKLR